jgi:hypothetical protein
MLEIATQMKNALTSMGEAVDQRLKNIERRQDIFENRNSNSTDIPSSNLSYDDQTSSYRMSNTNTIKVKPPTFDGTEDLNEFLISFQICSDLNNWNIRSKGLCLASCLKGDARSMLTEIDTRDHCDYKLLVDLLNQRYGPANRTDIFKAKLKTRVKQKGETISQLSQDIYRLTRNTYASASKEVIEAIALDHFIDAITDSEIRLRLKEISPKTLLEAEQAAIRLEAFRTADKQRNKLVASVTDPEQERKDLKLDTICKSLESINRDLNDLKRDQSNRSMTNRQHVPNNHFQRSRQNLPRYSNNNQTYNAHSNRNNRNENSTRRQNYNQSGNANQSTWWPTSRYNHQGRQSNH